MYLISIFLGWDWISNISLPSELLFLTITLVPSFIWLILPKLFISLTLLGSNKSNSLFACKRPPSFSYWSVLPFVTLPFLALDIILPRIWFWSIIRLALFWGVCRGLEKPALLTRPVAEAIPEWTTSIPPCMIMQSAGYDELQFTTWLLRLW